MATVWECRHKTITVEGSVFNTRNVRLLKINEHLNLNNESIGHRKPDFWI